MRAKEVGRDDFSVVEAVLRTLSLVCWVMVVMIGLGFRSWLSDVLIEPSPLVREVMEPIEPMEPMELSEENELKDEELGDLDSPEGAGAGARGSSGSSGSSDSRGGAAVCVSCLLSGFPPILTGEGLLCCLSLLLVISDTGLVDARSPVMVVDVATMSSAGRCDELSVLSCRVGGEVIGVKKVVEEDPLWFCVFSSAAVSISSLMELTFFSTDPSACANSVFVCSA